MLKNAIEETTPEKPKKKAPQLNHRRLSKKHVHAATLQAQSKTAKEICKAVGITGNQLSAMRLSKVFQEEAERQVTIFRNRVDGSILGQKAKRNEMREKLAKKVLHVVQSRAGLAAEDEELTRQGGKSGLVVQQKFFQKHGVDTRYAIDRAPIELVQSLMNDIAKENGEMGTGRDDGNKGVVVVVNLNREEQSWL